MTQASEPTPAATVILARPAPAGFEVYLLRRPDASSFMGGAWVFPGGKLDARDGEGESGVRRAAVRELQEETGVELSVDALTLWARWVTPVREARRFDARFFLAWLPEGTQAVRDPQETTAEVWLSPSEALDRSRSGGLRLMPPTLRNLELLATYGRFEDVLDAARSTEVAPICPTVEMLDGSTLAIILPGDPLHPDADRRVGGPTRIVLREGGFVSEEP